MRKILMFVESGIFPVRQGKDRLICEVARYLHGRGDVELTLAIDGGANPDRRIYGEICSDVIWWRRSSWWRLLRLPGVILMRLGFPLAEARLRALWLRGRFSRLAQMADMVIVNYAMWYPMIPVRMRRDKAIVLTHDLVFYRLASFRGESGWFSRMRIRLNRQWELCVLRSFRRVAVLADYEERLLVECGMNPKRVIRIGMPIATAKVKRTSPSYDFMFVGGLSVQNEMALECFLSRVVPLLEGRRICVAVAGPICESSFFTQAGFPDYVCFKRFGCVEDISAICARSRIGIGTIPCGSGIKVKVVEMMMSGLPVIATDHGMEGIPALPGSFVNIDRSTAEEIRAWMTRWLDGVNVGHAVQDDNARSLRRIFSPDRCLGALLAEERSCER